MWLPDSVFGLIVFSSPSSFLHCHRRRPRRLSQSCKKKSPAMPAHASSVAVGWMAVLSCPPSPPPPPPLQIPRFYVPLYSPISLVGSSMKLHSKLHPLVLHFMVWHFTLEKYIIAGKPASLCVTLVVHFSMLKALLKRPSLNLYYPY